jgi:hypothetical protein
MPCKLEITMLTTNHAKVNVKLNKIKSSGGGGGRGGSGARGGGTGRGNGNCGAEKGGGSTNDEEPEWMLARTTNTIKHPAQS